jgi:hypothetical protein
LAWKPSDWSWDTLKWRRWFGDRLIVVREECIVWTQTLHYVPLGGTMELAGPLVVLGLLVSGVLAPFYWLLGYRR